MNADFYLAGESEACEYDDFVNYMMTSPSRRPFEFKIKAPELMMVAMISDSEGILIQGDYVVIVAAENESDASGFLNAWHENHNYSTPVVESVIEKESE